MVKRFNSLSDEFKPLHRAYLAASEVALTSEVDIQVQDIIGQVVTSGDKAVLEFTQRFDKNPAVNCAQLRVTDEQIAQAYQSVDKKVITALEKAAERIRSYHEKQLPQDLDYTDDDGIRLGNLWRAIDRVGVYVPGGKAAYPSSVLMNVIPAHVAGVENIVMTVPAPGGVLNPVVLAAAKIAGVTEIFQIGGAQAIAALAYGTDTFPQVDMIVGPGNAYVAAAKRQLFGKVGIDMVAGPSEILVIADTTADSRWVAMDLLSQAEHDEAARSILVTTDAAYADAVIEAVEKHLQTLPRQEIARKSWEDNGAVYVVGSWDEAITISNEIAPEHLEIAVEDAHKLVSKIRNAGAVFVGTHVPEALGDYMAGPSHVLPTSGTARFSSGLSVFSFLKRMSLIGCDANAFSAIADDTVTLAQEEGLDAHALSVSIRKDS